MRRLLALSLCVSATAFAIATAEGCRMCASPYDYCGPVVESGGCGENGGGPAPVSKVAPYYNGTPNNDGDVMPAPPATNSAPQRTPTPATTPQSR
jgi:hypothetical protein